MKIEDLPKHRPQHPGALLADVLEDFQLTQQELADRLGIARHRLNEIIHGKRRITPDTALRLALVLGTSAAVWLREQEQLDLWDALHGPGAKAIAKLKPLRRREVA
jgi:addiction module HigA family antidote